MRQYILLVLAACTSAPDKRSGHVTLTSLQSGTTGRGYAEARFFTIEFPELASTSTPCELDRYISPQSPDGNFDAGVISVSGIPTSFTLTPEPSGDYVTYNFYQDLTRPLFSGGEAITVTASGRDVPPFSEQLVAPAPIVVTSPLPGRTATTSQFQSIRTSWSRGQAASPSYKSRWGASAGASWLFVDSLPAMAAG